MRWGGNPNVDAIGREAQHGTGLVMHAGGKSEGAVATLVGCGDGAADFENAAAEGEKGRSNGDSGGGGGDGKIVGMPTEGGSELSQNSHSDLKS
jgi:hypothetical protein